jgi:PAS domain S-box-containing protein
LSGSKDLKVVKERASREKPQENQPQDYAAAHLAALMESVTDLIWSVDLNFRLATFNNAFSDAFARELGVKIAAGTTPRDQLPSGRGAVFPPLYERALCQGPCAAEFRLADGRNLEMTFNPIVHDGRKVGVSVIGKDVTKQKSAKQALGEMAEQYRELFEFAPEAIYRIAREGKVLAVNPAGAKLLGYDSPGEAIAVLNDWGHQVWFDPQERAAFMGVLEEQGEARSLARQFKRKDGTLFWGIMSERKICGRDGGTLYYQGFMEDVTEQKTLGVDLSAKVRELHVLSEMNDALLRAKTEKELLTEYCRIVVEVGGYRMAWVGFAEEGPEKRIRPVAHYGHEDGYLNIVNMTWASKGRGQGPVGQCIRTGEIAVVKEFATDPTTALWREEGTKRGYVSCISIPFRHFEGERACLTAYGVRVSRWSDPERRLMDQVASALGYGIGTLRTALAKAQHQESLRVSLEQTIQVIAETVDQRDPYTAGHQRRVADLCVAIAGKLGLSSQRTQGLRLAAGIHDLGKIGIPAEILAKPGRLTENQFNLIKEHAQLGYEIVKSVQFPWPIAQMILQHHERLDGSGYPRGLKADEIFLESRILAVADVVEAMSSHRPYRPSRGIKVALDEVLSKSGALYDPEAVEACVNLFRREGYQFPRQ